MQVNRRILSLALLVLLLIGCNTSPEKTEAQATFIDAKIFVSPLVNPDINNRPSPIVVRIFELKNLGNYSESDFYGLFENYESILGGDILSSEQFNLNPGDTQGWKKNAAPETQYIAVIAAFRDINQAMWRDSIIISVEKNLRLLIYVDKLSISVWKK
ncbi:MAG: type VI secretion system lipoprotein TssJ [Methylococcales bacterium]